MNKKQVNKACKEKVFYLSIVVIQANLEPQFNLKNHCTLFNLRNPIKASILVNLTLAFLNPLCIQIISTL